MNPLSFADWLAPCEAEPPCGAALDYDPDFLALETLLQGKPEQQYGDTIIPAEKPDWRAVRQLSDQLLTRSKDLRIVGALTRALTAQEGLIGFGKGLGVISTLLNQHWDEVHPRLEQDGEHDALIRSNAVSLLNDAPTLLAEVRDCAFVSGGGVSISIREAELILAPNDNASPKTTPDQLHNMLVDQLARDATVLEAVEFASAQLETISWLCNQRLGTQESPDLSGASKLLRLVVSSVARARAATASSYAPSTESPTTTTQATATVSGIPTNLNSRADAIRALDAVCAYFERNEPSSPVPIFLNRAKRLTGMRFVDIIRDMSPESMNTIDLIAGNPGSTTVN